MPSKNMIPKGKRRQTVKPAYRAHRETLREEAERQRMETEALAWHGAPERADPDQKLEPAVAEERGVAAPEQPVAGDGLRTFQAGPEARGKRLDAYLASRMPQLSRGRVQLLIEKGQVHLDGVQAKASTKLVGGERVEVEGEPEPAPLRAEPEEIPLHVVYEDADLAVIDKAAGMTVHAGAGDAEHNRGTLVNALLFHFGQELSGGSEARGGVARPGIVHRLDKDTSGLIIVAKNDSAHRALAEMFAERSLEKTYIALVHGSPAREEGTVELPIGRDPVHRTRMTARRSVASGARAAVSHWRVLERIGNRAQPGPWGAFTLVEVRIETGRTHQIRVHMAAMGHPVVGDGLYGAPAQLRATQGVGEAREAGGRGGQGGTVRPTLPRNFLHAAELRFAQPRTGAVLELDAPLPAELLAFLDEVRGDPV